MSVPEGVKVSNIPDFHNEVKVVYQPWQGMLHYNAFTKLYVIQLLSENASAILSIPYLLTGQNMNYTGIQLLNMMMLLASEKTCGCVVGECKRMGCRIETGLQG